MLRRSVLLLWCACSALGQQGTATPLPTYDVVTVKPVKGQPTSGGYGDTPDGFVMRGLLLNALIAEAYNVRGDEISEGPGWLSSVRFDVEAKLDPEAAAALHTLPNEEQATKRRLMLQALLADRFHLQVHHITGVRVAYDLVLAKHGNRMPESPAPTKQEDGQLSTDWSYASGRISGHGEPMSILTRQIENATGTVVTDKTGLQGHYDVLLQWEPADPPPPDATRPPLRTALEEQLGLSLVATKTPFQKLVIDQIEMPTPN